MIIEMKLDMKTKTTRSGQKLVLTADVGGERVQQTIDLPGKGAGKPAPKTRKRKPR